MPCDRDLRHRWRELARDRVAHRRAVSLRRVLASTDAPVGQVPAPGAERRGVPCATVRGFDAGHAALRSRRPGAARRDAPRRSRPGGASRRRSARRGEAHERRLGRDDEVGLERLSMIWSTEALSEAAKTVTKATRASPIISADAVAAVRARVAHARSPRPSRPGDAEEPRSGRRRPPTSGRRCSGASTRRRRSMTSAPRPTDVQPGRRRPSDQAAISATPSDQDDAADDQPAAQRGGRDRDVVAHRGHRRHPRRAPGRQPGRDHGDARRRRR